MIINAIQMFAPFVIAAVHCQLGFQKLRSARILLALHLQPIVEVYSRMPAYCLDQGQQHVCHLHIRVTRDMRHRLACTRC